MFSFIQVVRSFMSLPVQDKEKLINTDTRIYKSLMCDIDSRIHESQENYSRMESPSEVEAALKDFHQNVLLSKQKDAGTLENLAPKFPILADKQLELDLVLDSKDLLVADPTHEPVRIISNFKLPLYKMPKKIVNFIKRGQTLKLIKGQLTRENYAEEFRALLFIEEAYRLIEMRRYDRQKVKLNQHLDLFVMMVPGLAERRPSLMQNDIVLVRSVSNSLSCIGYIHTVRKEDILIKLHKKVKPAQLINLRVSFLSSRTPFRRCHYAVEQYSENTKLDLASILFPIETKTNQKARIEVKEKDYLKLQCFNKKLNFYQRRAVVNVLEHVARPSPYLIWGPPGTGKTLTLSEIILQIHQRFATSKILVCTNTNIGADLLATKLARRVSEVELIRLSAFYRMKDLIPENLLSVTKDINALEAETYKKCRILVTTCIQAGALYNFENRFDYVFIDEASQACEPESLIPISLLKPGGSVVMAGDFMQLGPFSVCKLGATSLFERLSKLPLYSRRMYEGKLDYDDRYLSMLLNSYRSDKRVMAVNNELFYNGELQFPISMPKKFEGILGFEKTTIVHHVRGEDRRCDNSPSWYNFSEAMECGAYVSKLYHVGIKPYQLGVISPYRGQIAELRDFLVEQSLGVCKIGTIDEFQGDERDVIIISTVRTKNRQISKDKKFDLGFLFDPKRFNVATSRARWLTIVVGDTSILKKDPCWLKFINNSQTIGMGERFEKAMEDIAAKTAGLNVN